MFKVTYDYTDELGNKTTIDEEVKTEAEAKEVRDSLLEYDHYSNIQIVCISVD